MPELRQDPITGRWVVIAGNRAHRPHELRSAPAERIAQLCPFCAGNERHTTPATASYPAPNGMTPPDGTTPPWQVRVVTNLYPALVPSETPPGSFGTNWADRDSATRPAVGYHEVVIESPTHLTRLTELTDEQAGWVFRAYRDRLRHFRQADFPYGLAFKNCGAAAGMSLEHIHSQLVALPFVPETVQQELDGAARFFAQYKRCVFCELIEREQSQHVRLVAQSSRYLAFCPYASRFAMETWILPKTHAADYDVSSDDELAELAQFVRNVLQRLEAYLDQPAYNYFVHSSPFDTYSKDHYHWHIEIIPRLAAVAGLEWATGVHLNVVPPEEAAKSLRHVLSGT